MESLIRIDEVITEWNNGAPNGFRLCEDVNNIELCFKAIDNTTDCVMLMAFIHYQAFIVSIYASLLHPVVLGDNDQLLSFVQQSSLGKALKAGHILIHAVSHISAVAEGTSECKCVI